MINYEFASLFTDDSVYKEWEIQVYNEQGTLINTIDNDDIYLEEFEYNNPLNTDTTLRFGSCESSYVRFRVVSSVGTLKGKKLKIYVTPDTEDPLHPATALQVGEFYVDSDELSGDRESREILAYDILYKIINTDVLDWYRGVGLPMTMKAFRDAFFEYFGVTQVSTTLCNDNMPITEVEEVADSMSGLDVLTSILAGNGCLGTINNEGKFKYINFLDYSIINYDYEYRQGTLEYEDFLVQPIATLKFISNKCTITVGADPTSSSNIYIMEDNLLFYDKLEQDLQPFVENIFNVIRLVPAFRPLKVETLGNPCVEVGDMVTFKTAQDETIRTFVLSKIGTGLQSLKDAFETQGTEYYEYDLNNDNSKIRKLWNNTIELVSNAKCYVYAHRNSQVFHLDSITAKTIITIPLASEDECIPVFVATIPLVMSVDGEVTFRYFLDDIEINQNDNDTIYLTKGEQFVTLSTFIEMPANSRKRFTVTAQTGYRQSVEREQTAKIISLKDWIDNQSISVSTSGGVTTAEFTYDYVETPIDTTPPGATIDNGKIRAMIFASGLASEEPWDGKIIRNEPVTPVTLEDISVISANESLDITQRVPIPAGTSDVATPIILIDIEVPSATDTVIATLHTDSYAIVTEEEEALITEDGDYRLWTEGD